MATTYLTSRCLTVGCGWRSDAAGEAGIDSSESLHTSVSAHNRFERGERIHMDDEPELTVPLQTRPSRADREGDTQPLPVGNDQPHIHDLVAKDLADRKALGISRYGQPLQPHNGRNSLRDAYEEALDLTVYLATALYEQENPT